MSISDAELYKKLQGAKTHTGNNYISEISNARQSLEALKGMDGVSAEQANKMKSTFNSEAASGTIGAIGAVGQGLSGIIGTTMDAASIADLSQQENAVAQMGNIGRSGYGSFDDIQQDYAQLGQLNNSIDYSYDTVRGKSTGELVGDVFSTTAQGAMAGLTVGGPWGCVCDGTRVITKDGRFVNIEELSQADGIVGWDGWSCSVQSIYSFQAPAYKECVELTFDNGDTLRCSTDHPILSHSAGRSSRQTIDGKRVRVPSYTYTDAGDLQVGDIVASISEVHIFGQMTTPDARLLGMLIGDGSYGNHHGVRLFSAEQEIWDYIETNKLGYILNDDYSRYSVDFRTYKITNGAALLRKYGMYGQTKQEKAFPTNISSFSKASLSEFIAGLFDTDGSVPACVKAKETRIEFAQTNKMILDLLKEQLLKFGIHSYIVKHKESKSIIRRREVRSQSGYKLVIKDAQSVINFCDNIPLLVERKADAVKRAVEYKKTVKQRRPRYFGVYPIKIKSITPIGIQRIHNLQADDTHTYIANGIITHNSLIGAVVGLGAGLGGVFTGNAKARMASSLGQVEANRATAIAQQNISKSADTLRDSTFDNAFANRAARGGQLQRKTLNIKEFSEMVLNRQRQADRTHSLGIVRQHCKGGTMIRIKR